VGRLLVGAMESRCPQREADREEAGEREPGLDLPLPFIV
jgi:hypothetical protein